MKVNGQRRFKFEQGRNSWQRVKHAWLYSDLPQALKQETLTALSSQQRGPLFLQLTDLFLILNTHACLITNAEEHHQCQANI